MRGAKLLAATLLATLAFCVYAQTLLPGVDVGDTGGFQAAVLWRGASARQAYPLYYNLARPFVHTVASAIPARGLNLFSALAGALAVGLLAWLVARVAASIRAGLAAGLALAFSYTFWTQAVIAEVYTLHLALIAGCLIALHRCSQQSTRGRLTAFFAIYALAFGNHLSMILLLIPFAVFLLHTHPRRRELMTPAVVATAAGVAVVGALQYAPNFLYVWGSVDAPARWLDRVGAFWFDVTKSDWRSTMVLGIDGLHLSERLRMALWDARQQFGWIGLTVAGIGAVRIWTLSRPWAVLVWLSYAICTAFAITYNVGDTHVFFLPSHFFTAVMLGIAVTPARRALDEPHRHGKRARLASAAAHGLAIVTLAAVAWHAWDTWPAVDRHADRRGQMLVSSQTRGLDESHALLIESLEWQVENALLYTSRWERTSLAWARTADVMPYLPFLVADNHSRGRDVFLTADAAAIVAAAYPHLPIIPDDTVPVRSLLDIATSLPPGTPYVLTVLTPIDARDLSKAEVDRVIAAVTGRPSALPASANYQVVAGLAGQPSAYARGSDRPFRERFSVGGEPFTVRMESWLATDTFRRAGFGHVLRGRDHALIVERGASLVWFPADGTTHIVYAGGLYAPRPRFVIPRATTGFARLEPGVS